MHNSTTAEVGVSLKHIILPLWYSLVCNFSLCGHLSPVSLGNSFSDTSNSYLNGLWRVPRKERVIQSRFMSSQETNSPQCHTVLAGSAGGCGNGTSCRIWLETLEPWPALQNQTRACLRHWAVGLLSWWPLSTHKSMMASFKKVYAYGQKITKKKKKKSMCLKYRIFRQL